MPVHYTVEHFPVALNQNSIISDNDITIPNAQDDTYFVTQGNPPIPASPVVQDVLNLSDWPTYGQDGIISTYEAQGPLKMRFHSIPGYTLSAISFSYKGLSPDITQTWGDGFVRGWVLDSGNGDGFDSVTILGISIRDLGDPGTEDNILEVLVNLDPLSSIATLDKQLVLDIDGDAVPVTQPDSDEIFKISASLITPDSRLKIFGDVGNGVLSDNSMELFIGGSGTQYYDWTAVPGTGFSYPLYTKSTINVAGSNYDGYIGIINTLNNITWWVVPDDGYVVSRHSLSIEVNDSYGNILIGDINPTCEDSGSTLALYAGDAESFAGLGTTVDGTQELPMAFEYSFHLDDTYPGNSNSFSHYNWPNTFTEFNDGSWFGDVLPYTVSAISAPPYNCYDSNLNNSWANCDEEQNNYLLDLTQAGDFYPCTTYRYPVWTLIDPSVAEYGVDYGEFSNTESENDSWWDSIADDPPVQFINRSHWHHFTMDFYDILKYNQIPPACNLSEINDNTSLYDWADWCGNAVRITPNSSLSGYNFTANTNNEGQWLNLEIRITGKAVEACCAEDCNGGTIPFSATFEID